MAEGKLIKIVILPVAKRDLREIVDFIAQDSIKYAQLEKKLIVEAINRLKRLPGLGRPFQHKSINARQLVFRNYLIIYRFKADDVIEILTVHHHSRDIPNNPAFRDDE